MSTLVHSFPRCLQEYRHVISKSILDKNQNAGEICSLQPLQQLLSVPEFNTTLHKQPRAPRTADTAGVGGVL